MSMDLFAKYSSLRFIVLQNSGGVRCYLPRTSIYLPGHIFFPYNFYGLKRPENGHPLTKGHILMCVGCDWYSGENGAHTRIDKRAHLGVRSLSSRTVVTDISHIPICLLLPRTRYMLLVVYCGTIQVE
jgi:hypothetical protein